MEDGLEQGTAECVHGGGGTKGGNWDDDTSRPFSLAVLSFHSKYLLVAWGCEPPGRP